MVPAGTPKSADALEVGAAPLPAAVPAFGIRTRHAGTYKRVSPASSHLKTCEGASGSAAERRPRTKHVCKKK